MSSISPMERGKVIQAVSWKDDSSSKTFTIKKALPEMCEEISRVVQAAYFQDEIVKFTHRDPSQKDTFAVDDVKRRSLCPEKYTMLVCTVQEESCEKIVGTVYHQFAGADFVDQNKQPFGELGQLAVHPDYTKKFKIGSRLIEKVKELANGDKMPLYLYAIGSRKDGKFSNALLNYYEKHGFTFVANRLCTANAIYTTPTKRVEKAIMIYDPREPTPNTEITEIIRSEDNAIYKLPTQS